MSATSAVLRGRRMAEEQMIDTCIVSRPTGATSTDPNTGVVTDVVEQIYAGKSKRRSESQYEMTPDVGGQTVTIQRYIAHFPAGSFWPERGDVIEWTSCPLDPLRVGTKERIAGQFGVTFETAIRVYVEVGT